MSSVRFLSCCAVLWAGVMSQTAVGDVLFEDDFEDGVVNRAIYIPVGNAILTELGGKLQITTFGIGDGLEILVPSPARCISFSQSAGQAEFDVGEGWRISGFFDDAPGPDVEGLYIQKQRPFWNKCTIEIQVGEQTQTVCVGGG